MIKVSGVFLGRKVKFKFENKIYFLKLSNKKYIKIKFLDKESALKLAFYCVKELKRFLSCRIEFIKRRKNDITATKICSNSR